jgi:hypothetical protein
MQLIGEMVKNSYEGATVKIATLDRPIENVLIKRYAKQGCPLSQVLFDIYVNPLIEKPFSKEFRK